MSLLSDIEASVLPSGSTCRIREILAELTPADSADLETAIANRAIPASAIVNALKARGVVLGDTTVSRHRRGQCKCR